MNESDAMKKLTHAAFSSHHKVVISRLIDC